MADVFISYQRADRAAAEQIDATLKAAGYTTWWDTSLVAGEHWSETIREELRNAKCVVVIWSHRSWASRWVQAEAHSGFERDVLVACRIDDVGLEPPFNLVQAADVRNATGVTVLVDGVARKLGQAASRSAAPPRPVQATPRNKVLRPPKAAFRPTDYFGVMMVAGAIGTALFCVPAFAMNDARSGFLITPVYLAPVLIALFQTGRVGWWGVLWLLVAVTGAHFAAIFGAADPIYSSVPREGGARVISAQFAGLAGGGLGALLSMIAIWILAPESRTSKGYGWGVAAICLLSVLGWIGFLGPLPDVKDGPIWCLMLWAPWQLAFTAFVAKVIEPHQARRYVRAT